MPKVPENFLMQRRINGLDAYQPAADLAPGDLSDVTNLYSYNGELYSRLGKQACFVTVPSANPNYGMIEFVRSDGTSVIVFCNNGKLYFSTTGTPPLTSTEIKINGSTSFTLVSAGVQIRKAGKYLYVIDGSGSLYRVNVNADGTYTAIAVTALTAPSAPTAAARNTTIDAASDATKWSSLPSPVWPNSVSVSSPETISPAGQIFTGGASGGGASSQPPPTGWKTGGDTMDFQTSAVPGIGIEMYLDGGTGDEWCDWEYPTPTYANAPIANARVFVGAASAHASAGGGFYLQAYAEDATVENFNQASYTDIQITSVGATSVIKSAGQPFASSGAGNGGGGNGNGDVGKVVTIFTSSGGVTPGNYTIQSVDGSHNATVNGNLGSTASNVVGVLSLDSGYGSGANIWGNKNNYELTPPALVTGGIVSSPLLKAPGNNTPFQQVFSFTNLTANFDQTKFRIRGPASNVPTGVNSPSFKVVDVGLIPEAPASGTGIHVQAKNPVGAGYNCLGGAYLKRDYSGTTTNVTDLKIISSGASSVLQSLAQYTFVSGDVGKVVNITAGTGFTFGPYTITSVASGQATVTGNAGTSGSTGGSAGIFSVTDYSKSNIIAASYSAPTTSGQIPFRIGFLQAGKGISQINGATNATPIQIATTAAHGYTTGQAVTIASVGGNTAANGNWVATVVDSTHFTLNGSTGNGAYTSGGTATNVSSAIQWSNPVIYSSDGTYFYVDISTISSTVLAQTQALYLQITQDLPSTINPKDLFTFGPISASGNLSVGLATYNYTAVEANDNSLDTTGASTGNTTDGTVLSDPSGPSTPVITPTGFKAQVLLTLTAFVNAAANWMYIFRFGGALAGPNVTTYTSYALLAKCPRWSGGTNPATGWTWSSATGLWTSTDGYRTWNPTTFAFTDNTPDLSLIGADFLIAGRGAPPTGATAIEVWNNRLVLAKGSSIYISWLITTDAAAALYYNTTIDTEDPYGAIKGGVYPIEANDNDAIVQLKTHGQYLDIFKQKSVHLFTGVDPVSGFQSTPHLKGAGIGLVGGLNAVCAFDLNVAFVGPTGVHEYKADPIHTTFGALQQYELAEQAPIISQKIEPLLAPFLKGGTAISAAAYQKCVLIYHGRRLWLFAPAVGGTSNTVAYVYDTRAATDGSGPVGWTKHTTFNIVSACQLAGANDTDDLYMGGDDGQIYKLAGNGDVSGLTAITGATNASPIVITAASHGFSNAQKVQVTGVGGNTAANGNWYAGSVTSNTFALYQDSALTTPVAGNGTYSAATGATGALNAIAWSWFSRGFMNETNDFRYFKVNRPTRAYFLISTNENAAVALKVNVVGSTGGSSQPTDFSTSYTLNGQQLDVRFKVPPEIRGYGAVRVGGSGSTTSQSRITAFGVEDAKGAIRGNV